MTTNATFAGAVRKFWNSLKGRHRSGKYGPILIEREQFEAWLKGKSTAGLTWKCEYTGNVVQLMAKTQAGRLTIDHRVPLAQGGTTTLDNLAVCSEEANKIKGDMSIGAYGRLMRCLATELEGDRMSVLKRLKGWEPIYKRRGR
jgi:hypothetical protein